VKVLLTGAAGRIGTMLTARLPALGWEVRAMDRVGLDGRDTVTGDITDPAVLDIAMAGVSAVVHLAGQPTEAPWPVVREGNIEGTFQVFEAARRAGVDRVIYASSNHAVGFTPHGEGELAADTVPRPDTLYGVSKVFGEALGRYYADRYAMKVACLRIGTCHDDPPDDRSLATWLSPGDCSRLVDACLRSEDLSYALIWGVSANRHRWWSLVAGQELGYQPADDAAERRSEWSAHDRTDIDAVVGGTYTSPAFGIDEIASQEVKQ
jgi:uronate dehydrogenase